MRVAGHVIDDRVFALSAFSCKTLKLHVHVVEQNKVQDVQQNSSEGCRNNKPVCRRCALLTTAEHLQTERRGAGVCGQRQGIDS